MDKERQACIAAKPVLSVVQSIYDTHKKKLNNLKENRAKCEEEKWTDAEIKSVDEQIVLLASVLSDLNKYILHCCYNPKTYEWVS